MISWVVEKYWEYGLIALMACLCLVFFKLPSNCKLNRKNTLGKK